MQRQCAECGHSLTSIWKQKRLFPFPISGRPLLPATRKWQKIKKEEKFRTSQVITRIMRQATQQRKSIHPFCGGPRRGRMDAEGRDQFTLSRLRASFIQLLLFVFIPDRPESRERETERKAAGALRRTLLIRFDCQ
jgi:hypothetical protein